MLLVCVCHPGVYSWCSRACGPGNLIQSANRPQATGEESESSKIKQADTAAKVTLWHAMHTQAHMHTCIYVPACQGRLMLGHSNLLPATAG